LRVIIVVVQVGAVKIYAAAVEALRKKEKRMKLSLPPKLVKNINPVFFVKFSFPVMHLMPYYVETSLFWLLIV
jgi:hypothetical protein